MLLLLLTGFQYYYDSPFGKTHQITIFFSSVKCTGDEAQITDCAKNNLTFEEGKKLVNHIGVAGVSCKRHCPTVISTQFITITAYSKIIETQLSQQMQSSTDSEYATATFLLAGISGTLATVTVILAVW